MEIVDLTVFWPWGLLIALSRGIAVYLFMHILIKDRFHPLVTLAAVLVTTAVYRYGSQNMPSEMLQLLLYYVLLYLVMLVCKQAGAVTVLLYLMLAILLQQVGATFSALPLCFIFPNALYYLMVYEVPRNFAVTTLLFTILFSMSFSLILRSIVTRRRGKTDGYHGKFGFFVLFPLSHILCGLLFFRLVQMIGEEMYNRYIEQYPFTNTLITLVFSLCLVLDFFIFFIIDRMEKAEQKNVQNEKLLVQNKMDYESALLLREEKREFQKIKHDFANILAVAQGYIEIGKTDKALSVLSSTQLNLSGISGFSLCASETLNVIFYIKTTQAANIGVKLDSEIREECGSRIDDYDLCRVLFNLIDNCLHAVERLKEDKIFHVTVSITEAQITIHTRNRFLSVSARTKTEGGHGNGVGIIREICAKYGGSYAAHTVGDMYYTDTVMQNRSPTSDTLHNKMK